MISERILTAFLRSKFGISLNLKPVFPPRLPTPCQGREYTLYIHIPFCESLCPYCSFHRFVFQKKNIEAYYHRVSTEMQEIARLGYRFKSLYVGGGTPTILAGELASIIDTARQLFGVQEVSCETNPNHLIPEVLEVLKGRVQRLSVGVQSFDSRLLGQMDRLEKYGSGQQILQKLEQAAGYFPTLNIDMIYNFPRQSLDVLQNDITCAIQSAANQVTFYPLMTSPSVNQALLNKIGKVDYSREADQYRLILDELKASFVSQSAWTFSRRGGDMIDEYVVGGEDYVGIGSGAFSYLQGALYVNTFSLKEYEFAITAGKLPVTSKVSFWKHDQMRYYFLMNLFGLSLDKQDFRKKFGIPLELGLFPEVTYLRLAGAFERDDNQMLTLNTKGQYLLVVMMREFFSNMDRIRDQARLHLEDMPGQTVLDEGTAECGGVISGRGS